MFLRMTHRGCCDGDSYNLECSKQSLDVSGDLEVKMPERGTLAVDCVCPCGKMGDE